MNARAQDWIVLHRVRFSELINVTGNPLPGPAGAEAWRFYPSSGPGPDGMRSNLSDEWGGFGFYRSREAAQAVFDAPGPDDFPRIVEFLRRVDQVQEAYAELQGNLRRAVFSGATVDGHDGLTVSIWRDDAAMFTAAYRPGVHNTQMDHHKEVDLFDRSSFGRARILDSKGAWDGGDPVTELG